MSNQHMFKKALDYYKNIYPTMNLENEYLKKYNEELIFCYLHNFQVLSVFDDWTCLNELLDTRVEFTLAQKTIESFKLIYKKNIIELSKKNPNDIKNLKKQLEIEKQKIIYEEPCFEFSTNLEVLDENLFSEPDICSIHEPHLEELKIYMKWNAYTCSKSMQYFEQNKLNLKDYDLVCVFEGRKRNSVNGYHILYEDKLTKTFLNEELSLDDTEGTILMQQLHEFTVERYGLNPTDIINEVRQNFEKGRIAVRKGKRIDCDKDEQER